MSKTLCIHCIVSGRVQGVWFRANTRERAQQLGLKGWVRNLPDGRVEVLACGSEAALEGLHRWLHQGSPRARVDGVSYEVLPWQEFHDFSIH